MRSGIWCWSFVCLLAVFATPADAALVSFTGGEGRYFSNGVHTATGTPTDTNTGGLAGFTVTTEISRQHSSANSVVHTIQDNTVGRIGVNATVGSGGGNWMTH